MALLCVHTNVARVYFDTADVVKVEVPADIPTGKKPAGWCDDYAAEILLGRRGDPVSLPVGHDEWPAVRQALGLSGAHDVNKRG